MKLSKDIIYTYLIFISIFLVFLDAYQFYSIPLSWIGLILLVPVSIYEIKNTKLSKYSKAIYLISIPFVIPELFYIFRNELTFSELKKIEPMLTSDVMKVFDLKYSVNSKKSFGGTSFDNIKKMILKYKRKK